MLEATLQELVRAGYGALSLDTIARTAGVSKATLYRRWQSRDGLVLDAAEWFGLSHADVPDSGDFGDDLRLWARSVRRLLSDPTTGPIVRAVLAADSQGTHDVRRQFWLTRMQRVRPIVERAISRQEIPPDTDVEEVIRHVGAPLYYRMLVLDEPVTVQAADLAAAVTAAAARQGVFGSSPR